jgi:hypothetical protein
MRADYGHETNPGEVGKPVRSSASVRPDRLFTLILKRQHCVTV